MYVIEYNRLTVTWSLGKTHIARDYSLEDLLAEKAAQVRADLPRQRGPLIVHGQQNSLDAEIAIQSPADAH
jgi:hypothetical protein